MAYNVKGSMNVVKDIQAGESVTSKLIEAADSFRLPVWKTTFDYVERDEVLFDNDVYICIVDHTSSVFATDIVNWKRLGSVETEDNLTGDGSILNPLEINYSTDLNNKAENGSDDRLYVKRDYFGKVNNLNERLAVDDYVGQTVWQNDGGQLGIGALYFQYMSPSTLQNNWVLIGERDQLFTFDSTTSTFDITSVTFDTV